MTSKTAPSWWPLAIKMAAPDTRKSTVRAPSFPKYCDSVGATEKINYNKKLKFTVGINPYSVSSDFYSESMEKWPEVELVNTQKSS